MSIAALAEEMPPVPAPEPVEVWTCPYDLIPTARIAALNSAPLARPAPKEDVRQTLDVIPCSLHGTTPLVANAKGGQAKISKGGLNRSTQHLSCTEEIEITC